mmetsp:Transcript_19738/g.29524  ORF Transcript_19738/g.29524 Transcript_19738/m.29524 type:complete len:715 (+) Transcript_19738:294-2438(+)
MNHYSNNYQYSGSSSVNTGNDTGTSAADFTIDMNSTATPDKQFIQQQHQNQNQHQHQLVPAAQASPHSIMVQNTDTPGPTFGSYMESVTPQGKGNDKGKGKAQNKGQPQQMAAAYQPQYPSSMPQQQQQQSQQQMQSQQMQQYAPSQSNLQLFQSPNNAPQPHGQYQQQMQQQPPPQQGYQQYQQPSQQQMQQMHQQQMHQQHLPQPTKLNYQYYPPSSPMGGRPGQVQNQNQNQQTQQTQTQPQPVSPPHLHHVTSPTPPFQQQHQQLRASLATPTNQPIQTHTPNAPKKGPRPTKPSPNQEHNGILGTRPRSTSIASSDTSARTSSSVLDDPTFAPPPPYPENLNVIKSNFFGQSNKEVKSTLPSFGLVTHSGQIMARFSIKSMIIKKWRQSFWITYGDNQLMFFRTKNDFEEWVSNPFLTKDERDGLVKLNVDFRNDLYKPSVTGYSATIIRSKDYSKQGLLYHFKLEKWMDYGPIITAAFAGKNQNDVYCLRSIICNMIERSPQRHRNSNRSDNSSVYDSDGRSIRSVSTNASAKSSRSLRSARSVRSVKSTKSAPGYSMIRSSANQFPGMRGSMKRDNNVSQPASNGGYFDENESKKKNIFKRNNSKSSQGKNSEENDRATMMIEEIRTRSKSADPPKKGGRFGRKSSQTQMQQHNWNNDNTNAFEAQPPKREGRFGRKSSQTQTQQFNWNNQNPNTFGVRQADVDYGF